MDKKTILAVVLSVVVITISLWVQTAFFTPEVSTVVENPVVAEGTSPVVAPSSKQTLKAVEETSVSAEKFIYETDLFQIEFDPAGASVASMGMKGHQDSVGNSVDLVFRGEADENAFLMYWGNDLDNPVLDVFSHRVEGNKVIFTKTYQAEDGSSFDVIKTFEFRPSDYLIAVTVDIENPSGLNYSNYAYSLSFGPQVGPAFKEMSNNNYDYRRFYTSAYKENGTTKKSQVKLSSGQYTTNSSLKWMSLTSKYFNVVAVPDSSVQYTYTAKQTTSENVNSVSQKDVMYFSRPATGSATSDTMYFYCGPQLKSYMGSYYSGNDNAWGLKNLNLDDAMEGGSWLGWLENFLKWALTLLYKIIPNYGIDIIILTILIKLALWPLSKKGMESTAKMSALTPQMDALKTKYADNPQKMNQEVAALYKNAGVSPMGGCLPMFLQFPIFIALYGLLNKHFELRGAMFIPGWIPDLSIPDTVLEFGFKIPFIGSQLHLLPIIYTVSMIYSMRITQSKSQQQAAGGKNTMWFMTYGMPIIFFFVLYSAPSGLLLYWSVQNALSILQQFYTNAKTKKNADKPKTEPEKVPEAVRKYQEKLERQKRLAEEKAKLENKKGKK